MNPRYLHSIDELDNLVGLTPKEKQEMESVTRKFPFRANSYYLSLIDWKDRHDPLRRIIIPDLRETKEGGSLDPSSEKNYTKVPGLQHKYPQTALLLMSDICGGICRFCFRKRLFLDSGRETVRDIFQCLEYIRSHPQISNVLLSGGDPFTLETGQIESVLRELHEIKHVRAIRIGTKMLAYNPYRFLNDPHLLTVLSRYSTPEKRIYIIAHFNHPQEITPVSIQAIDRLLRSGVIVMNQTPILRGINSNPGVLASLLRTLTAIGIAPYYIFQCRPSVGNKHFQVPVEESYDIIQESWKACSGLAKRARFIMSHATGKIEIIGRTAKHTFMRYHQAADQEKIGKTMVFQSEPTACWLDHYRAPVNSVESLLALKMPSMHWLF
jgi:KamA family protein